MRIGILGSGVVGQTLARGLARHGHEVRIGTRKDVVEDLPTGSPGDVVESGAYGRCETCGAEIGSERLAARPSARTCITCAR